MQPDNAVPDKLQTPWMRDRDRWVRELSGEDLLRVVAEVSSSAHLDENEGDRTETAQALEWLTSRGQRGYEWGHAGAAARRLGLWSGGQDAA